MRDLLRLGEANEVPISSHIYTVRLDDIQKALIPLKKSEKLKYIFMTISGLAE